MNVELIIGKNYGIDFIKSLSDHISNRAFRRQRRLSSLEKVSCCTVR